MSVMVDVMPVVAVVVMAVVAMRVGTVPGAVSMDVPVTAILVAHEHGLIRRRSLRRRKDGERAQGHRGP
jgi:hypothetical protein